jgi:hypothetical protein
MKQRTLLFLPPAVILLYLPLMLSGCARHTTNTAQTGAAPTGTSNTLAQQMKAIDDNTHMPPQVKEAAKASLMQGQNVRPVVK